jgi:hypothetical protein
LIQHELIFKIGKQGKHAKESKNIVSCILSGKYASNALMLSVLDMEILKVI